MVQWLGYGLDGPWFKFWQKQESFCSPKHPYPLWVPTQPPIKWISKIKRPEREDDHSVSSSAKVKNEGATPPVLPCASKASMEQHHVSRVMELPWRICSIIVFDFPISVVKCHACLINTRKARGQDKLINILLIILETARFKEKSYRYLNVSVSSLCRVC
jgi:hypothetical protein